MDSPVIFKRKGNAAKPVKRVREKSPESQSKTDTDGGLATPTVEVSPSTLATKLKKKIQKSRPKSRLSFGGDDEVRMSSLSSVLLIELNSCDIGR